MPSDAKPSIHLSEFKKLYVQCSANNISVNELKSTLPVPGNISIYPVAHVGILVIAHFHDILP